MSTTTDLDTLKINYLSQAEYDAAKSQNELEADEIYLTPSIPHPTVSGTNLILS